MELLDKDGLTKYSKNLAKTNKVFKVTVPINKYYSAPSVNSTFCTYLKNNLNNFVNIYNASIILNGVGDKDRGIFQYVGNGANTASEIKGFVTGYVFDSGGTNLKVTDIIKNGNVIIS